MTEHKLLVIVACEKDSPSAHVLGAFNYEFMSDLPAEDYDIEIEKLKQTWTGEPEMYHFREITVTFEADLDSLFGQTEYQGYAR